MNKIIIFLSFVLVPFIVLAGGNPDQVKFPEGYQTDFTHYHTMNRAGKPLLAKMYANKQAMESVGTGQLHDDAIVIMEVYKAMMDADGKPMTGDDGLYQQGNLAAVAVMEKQQWGEDYPEAERAGDWGFAMYNPDGSPKENDLKCASCHVPFKEQDYLYTFKELTAAQ